MGLTTVITLLNQTGSSKTYVNGQVSLPASGNVNVSSGLIPFLAIDPNFLGDVTINLVAVSDTVNTYTGDSAVQFIKENWITGITPQNSSDPVAFSLAGYGFSITADAALANTSETNLLLLKNPANSGFNGRALFLYAATDSTQGLLTTRAYVNPTVTNNGTDISSIIQNNFVGNAGNPSAIMQAFSGPTTSALGAKRISLVSAAQTSPPIHDFKQTPILAPGNSLLITGQAANLGLLANLSCHFFLEWVEV